MPSKINTFGWRIFSNVVPTRDLLLHRQMIESEEAALCPFCRHHLEDLLHLFCNFELVKQVWDKVGRWLGVQVISTINIVGLATCWSIWIAKNNLIFKGEESVLDSIVNHIKCTYWSWFIYWAGSRSGYSVSAWGNNALLFINNS